jgi:hypothetical protein
MDQIINLCPIKTHIHALLPLQSGKTPHHLQVNAVRTCLYRVLILLLTNAFLKTVF